MVLVSFDAIMVHNGMAEDAFDGFARHGANNLDPAWKFNVILVLSLNLVEICLQPRRGSCVQGMAKQVSHFLCYYTADSGNDWSVYQLYNK